MRIWILGDKGGVLSVERARNWHHNGQSYVYLWPQGTSCSWLREAEALQWSGGQANYKVVDGAP